MSGDYFDTPVRAERLQLLLHLVRNAGEVLYLRAPAGSGKTRFAHQLLDILGDEIATVWVQADADSDVPMTAVDQLGMSVEEASPWPDAMMAGLAGQDLLTIVDDADRLGLEAVESLALLHARGGRLLLVGQGGLARTNGNWDVQFVDLPPFDAVQTTAFLRAQAGDHATRVTDDLAAGLHRASKGLPGPLLDALQGVLGNAETSRRAPKVAAPVAEGARGPVWPWAFGGLVLIVLLSVLLFQDQINALFTPPATHPTTPVVAEGMVTEPAPVVEREPATSDDARAEAVSALMPEVSLSELGRRTADAELDAMPTAAGTLSETSGIGTDPQPASSAETGPNGDAADPVEAVMQDALAAEVKPKPDVDPLDAVMQDALAAAEAGNRADADTVVSTREPIPVDVQAADPGVASTASAPPSASREEPSQPAPEPAVVKTPEPAQVPKPPAVVESRSENDKPAPRVTEQPVEKTPQAVPAPVETRQPAPVSKPAAGPKTASPAATVGDTGIAWLRDRPAGRYTLQLVGSRDRAAVRKFVRDFGIQAPYAIFERDLKGKPWYSLVAGDYPDRDAAVAARARLPKRLERSGVWPRSFESIQKTM